EVIVQKSRPNRKVYRLTAAGQAELDRWLEEDVPERFSEDDFLTKLFFCGETSDEVALKHLLEHRLSLLKQLEHMEWARQQYATRPTRRPRLLEYQMLVRDYKESVLKAGLEVTEAIRRNSGHSRKRFHNFWYSGKCVIVRVLYWKSLTRRRARFSQPR